MMRGVLVDPIKKWLYPSFFRPLSVYRRLISQYAGGAESILDIGCGHTAPELHALRAPNAQKLGIDIDADLHPGQAPNIQIIRADCGSLPIASESVDLVISRSVLEHLDDPDSVFREVSRILRIGGHFVFLTPNRWDYVSVLSSLIPNSWHPWLVRVLTGRADEDTFPTRYKANSRRQLRRLAKHSGLQVLQQDLLREHPHYLSLTSLTYLTGVIVEQFFQRPIHPIRPWILGVFHRGSETQT